MGKYSCTKCLKDFKQKSHYENHINRKNPCVSVVNKLEVLVDKIVDDKLELLLNEKLNISDDIEENDNITNDNIIEQINQQSLKPIIKWSGGKSDEIKLFKKHIPKEYTIYLEPFIGGGSVFFHLVPKKAVITDVHTELIDFYTAIKEGNANKIYEFMEKTPNNDTTYYKVRDEMKIETPLDSAKRFYYQRKTCFRGMLRYNKSGHFNIPFGKYKTINYKDLKNESYFNLLQQTEIVKASYEYVFEKYNDKDNFMFLDPPYDSEFTDYGYCKFDREDQKKLFERFATTKSKCLLVISSPTLPAYNLNL